MKKSCYLILIGLLFSVNAIGQKLELGKVTLQELQEKKHPKDTSAVAAIIFKKSTITYDNSTGQVVTVTEIKLKIYKKEGYDYANIKEAYYNGNNESVDFKDAFTYNLVNDQIVKSKLKKESEFKEELTKNIVIKKIAMPDVKEGSIIEYKIKRHSNNSFSLVNYYFQEKIPINDIELKVEYPRRFYYNKTLSGYLRPKMLDETFDDVNSGWVQDRSNYWLKDVPAFKDEGYVNNIDNFRSRIHYELASVKNGLGISQNISTDWETVAKKICQSEHFGEELKKKGYFEKDADRILAGLTTREERINAIFGFVRSKMTWNENQGYFCYEGVKKAYVNNNGNVAEINLMLTAMLRYAGLEANPILLSTRSNGLPAFPTIAAFNYVICGIELPDQIMLLDATDKNAVPDILPIRDLNWIGRVVRGNESSAEINLLPKAHSSNAVSILATINGNGEITGKIRDQYSDYNAYGFRHLNNDLSKDIYIEKIEKKYQGLEIGEYEVANKTNLTKPVIENYDFKTTSSVEIIGDKMYVSPFLFFATTENPFKQEIRLYPIDFIFPNEDKFNISLTIPEGYAIETLPQSKAVAMPKNIGSFKYSCSNTGNQVQLLFTQDINEAVIDAEYYEALKNFFKEIINKQTEKIVLKKV